MLLSHVLNIFDPVFYSLGISQEELRTDGMALITLRRNLCHLSDFWLHGALAAVKNPPVNHVHKVVKEHLCPWVCSLQPEPFRVSIIPVVKRSIQKMEITIQSVS